MIYSTWRNIVPDTDTLGNEHLFPYYLDLKWVYFLLTSHDLPPTLPRKSPPQPACCLPGGPCLRRWLMAVVLWPLLLICQLTFLLVALFEKLVGTCSISPSTMHLRAFITITMSALLLSGEVENGSENNTLNRCTHLAYAPPLPDPQRKSTAAFTPLQLH